jgi:hypothetical protein
MPTSATTAGGTQAQARPRGGQQAVLPTVPFIRASAEHREPAGIDVSRVLTAADQDLGVFDIPAYGYVRRIVILVTAAGGTGGAPAVTLAEDQPFSGLKNIALTEPNGAVLSQFNSGYEMHLANKWGGYRHVVGADMKASPVHVDPGTTFASFSWISAIPVELNLRDGLGSLPNQNAAATFKLRLTLAGTSAYGTGTFPTTLPTVRVRAYAECWDQPEANTAGATNQITPPAMNTTQFWSSQVYNVAAGQNTIRLTRVGNYLRNLIMIYKTTTDGTRLDAEGDWPDPLTVYLDTRPLDIIEFQNFRHQMYERTGFGGQYGTASAQVAPQNDRARALDNGVRVYDFMHEFDGTLGQENRDLWLPTLGSTRLELQGSFGEAGTLTVLTNDVAIAGSVFM